MAKLKMAPNVSEHFVPIENSLETLESGRARTAEGEYRRQIPVWIAGAAANLVRSYQLDSTTGLQIHLSSHMFPRGRHDLKKLEEEYLAEVERVYGELRARFEACILRAEKLGMKVR